jgi:hypothetical protein
MTSVRMISLFLQDVALRNAEAVLFIYDSR